jgi:formate hydrogenlyase transcriptional activator
MVSAGNPFIGAGFTETNVDAWSRTDGHFRNDLYYRLNVFPVMLPPLRERRSDIPLLARHFSQLFAQRMGRRIETIPTAVMDALVNYSWPGNIREMQNVIERAVILSRGAELELSVSELQQQKKDDATGAPGSASTLEQADREHILRVLREVNWIIGGPEGAAARLGMKRTTLQSKMRKLGIARPQ